MELAAIRVVIGSKIGERGSLQAAYPPFGQCQAVRNSGMDWSTYVDQFGGWIYDKSSGHADDTAESPIGQQFGVLLVPEDFAVEAVARFPDQVTRLSETELEAFYETCATAHQDDVKRDVPALQGLQADLGLLKETNAPPEQIAIVEEKARKALDPDDPMPGVTRPARRKKWVDEKARRKVTIKEEQRR